ncbi:MAG: branched-chain amino acid aminotransferase, partial [Candidatus Omnitrophota bacterium]
EIIPVIKVDGREIGDVKLGRITKIIMSEFKKVTKTAGVSYSLI